MSIGTAELAFRVSTRWQLSLRPKALHAPHPIGQHCTHAGETNVHCSRVLRAATAVCLFLKDSHAFGQPFSIFRRSLSLAPSAEAVTCHARAHWPSDSPRARLMGTRNRTTRGAPMRLSLPSDKPLILLFLTFPFFLGAILAAAAPARAAPLGRLYCCSTLLYALQGRRETGRSSAAPLFAGVVAARMLLFWSLPPFKHLSFRQQQLWSRFPFRHAPHLRALVWSRRVVPRRGTWWRRTGDLMRSQLRIANGGDLYKALPLTHTYEYCTRTKLRIGSLLRS